MFPLIGGKFPVYGLTLLFGIAISLYVFRLFAKRQFSDFETVFDFALITLLAGLAGARILHVAVSGGRYFSDPINIFKVNDGGFTFLGGVIGAFVVIFIIRKKIPIYRFADLCAIGVSIAHFFGRLGCNFAGCCWGKKTSCEACGLKFNQFSAVEEYYRAAGFETGLFRYPAQLIEATFVFLIFVFLIFRSQRKKIDGELLITYLIIYGFGRILIEIIRGDPGRGVLIEIKTVNMGVVGIYTSQIIGLAMITGGIFLYNKIRKP